MPFKAALASRVVASTATVWPWSRPLASARRRTKAETSSWTASGRRWRTLGRAGGGGGRAGGEVAQEGLQAAAVGTAPGDAALGVEALEVADEEHAEVHARRDAGAADAVGVEGAAQVFDEGVEARLLQKL